jgi:hypothetical protein
MRLYIVLFEFLCLSKVIDTLESIHSWLFWILAIEYWIAFLSIIHVHLLNPGVVGIGVSDIALDESDIPISCNFCGWCVLHDHCAQHPSKENKGIHFLLGCLICSIRLQACNVIVMKWCMVYDFIHISDQWHVQRDIYCVELQDWV